MTPYYHLFHRDQKNESKADDPVFREKKDPIFFIHPLTLRCYFQCHIMNIYSIQVSCQG